MRKLAFVFGFAVTALLGACGGGGGSPGDTQLAYTISLRADRTELPINIARLPPGSGAYFPYTTTLYVEAREGGRPILDQEDGAFSCSIAAGLDSGALYYLDGNEEHEDDDGNPLAYRGIVLGSNSGGASFHFHAADKAGTARIICSITNPRDNQVSSASVDIVVGAATGLPASIQGGAQAPGYLGSRYNTNNVRNNVGVQAFVTDDANQPVSDPAQPNVQVRILPTTAAADGARLMAGIQAGGSVVQARTLRGVAQFSLTSGPERGVILLELLTDRRDNDVSNGIQDPVAQLMAISVVHGVALEPLVVPAVTLDVPNATPFAYALEANGGEPPYDWTAFDPLPSGLDLSRAGVISGTPRVLKGSYVVRVGVVDALGDAASAVVTINITDPLAPLVFDAPSVTASLNLPFSYALMATGGEMPYAWEALGVLPSGLTLDKSAGVIKGTPTVPGIYSLALRVTDSAGTSAVANMTIDVPAPEPEPKPDGEAR